MATESKRPRYEVRLQTAMKSGKVNEKYQCRSFMENQFRSLIGKEKLDVILLADIC